MRMMIERTNKHFFSLRKQQGELPFYVAESGMFFMGFNYDKINALKVKNETIKLFSSS